MLDPIFYKAKLSTQAISDGSGCQAGQDHRENSSSNFILTIPIPVFSNKQENRGKQSKSQKSTQQFLQDLKKFRIQFDVKVHETYQNTSTLLIALV